jgi:hypothetical protein
LRKPAQELPEPAQEFIVSKTYFRFEMSILSINILLFAEMSFVGTS